MKEKTRELFDKAKRSIEAAQLLLRNEQIDFAASRAYYALFYAAEALLFEKDLEFRKHSGVHAAFGEHFAKSGVMDSKFHGYLLDAFEARLEGDYGIGIEIRSEKVAIIIQRAQEFLQVSQEHVSLID
ncbi:HEPN domain-containing protein [Acidobacteria bacterium AH-259-L09]|nr:HEPN domain-containing protein [Acidobacteria bacterium AH-259-L09]